MIALIFVALAGIFKGCADTLLHHFSTSVFKDKNPIYWDPYQSWKAKYKNGNPDEGEAFPGSTTIFVALTDWWHRFDLFRIVSWCLALGFATDYEWNNFKLIGIALVVFLTSFQVTYVLLRKY